MKSKEERIAMAIILKAKQFRKEARRRMTYTDYEMFKQEMHEQECYGFESELAQVLGV